MGQWFCRACAAKAVEREKTHFGDPANKKPDPGYCDKCQMPGILFWVEPIQQEVTPRCGDCRFRIPTTDFQERNETGECRRYPPQVTSDAEGILQSDFPFVNCPDAWCGEFQAKAK